MQTGSVVIPFRHRKEIPCQKALDDLRSRVIEEVFDGDEAAFEAAFAEASVEQTIELMDAIFDLLGDIATKGENLLDLKEELYDAMIGVMKQWLGEAYAEDECFVLEAYGL